MTDSDYIDSEIFKNKIKQKVNKQNFFIFEKE